VLGTVSVENMSPGAEGVRLDEGAMERDLRTALESSGLFAPAGSGGEADGGAGPIARARLAVAVEIVDVGTKAEARARVRLHVDTRPSSAPAAVAMDLEGQGMEPRPPRKRARGDDPAAQPLGPLALRVAKDLLDAFVAKRRLYDGPPAGVHAALMADGGELREEAIRAVGERQLRDEAPTLLKLLNDDDETIRDAALGSLIALRDRRAVSELTRTRSLRDRREMRKIIEAISILGGQEAEEYLSFVAATHDDDEIRAEATAARTRLLRRQADGETGR
jgi:HEAT repeat protein